MSLRNCLRQSQLSQPLKDSIVRMVRARIGDVGLNLKDASVAVVSELHDGASKSRASIAEALTNATSFKAGSAAIQPPAKEQQQSQASAATSDNTGQLPIESKSVDQAAEEHASFPGMSSHPRIQVEPLPGGNAKSPFQILKDFSEKMRKALRVRRLKKWGLGVYRPGSTMTAIRFAGDLDTAAHEFAGHWLDDKHGIAKPWVKSGAKSPYDKELETFWWHGSSTPTGPRSTLRYKRAEGIAEFIRAYIMNPDAARAQAPLFAAYFEKTVPAEALAALNEFSSDIRTWVGEDPVRRASLNVRMEPPSLWEKLWSGITGRGFGFDIGLTDRLRMWFDDPYWYAVKAFRQAAAMRGKTNPKTLRPAENFELLARLLASHDSRLSDQLENGLVTLRPRQVTNADGKLVVSRIIDPKTGSPITLEWLLAAFDRTNPDAMLQDMREVSGMMIAERTLERAKIIDAEATEAINQLDPMDPNWSKKLQAIRAEAELKKAHVSGLGAGIMPDTKAAQETLQALAQDPVKQQRFKEAARRYRLWGENNLRLLVESGRLSQDQMSEILDRNEFYVDMHRLSEEFELSNPRAGGSLASPADLIKRFKGSTLEVNNVYENLLEQTDAIQKEAHRNMVMRAFTAMFEELRGMHQGAPVDFDQFGSVASSADRNTIKVWKGGKAEYWKFEQPIIEALRGLGDLGTHAFIEWLSIPSQIARYLITHGPAFVARNVVRDTVHRSVIGTPGSKPWDVLGGYTQEELSRYDIFGGGQFGNYTRDQHTWSRELKRAIQEMAKDPANIVINPLNFVGQLWGAWENIAGASEKLGRIAEFRRAFERGKTEFGYTDYEAALYAAGEARGLIDYAQAGTIMRAINKLVPFSNARLRGLIRSMKAAKDNPAGFVMRWGMHVLLPTMLMLAWNRQDDETWEEYQQQPEYLKDFFWSFKVGPWWIRIPRPHELGVMAGGVERALNAAMGDKHAMEGWGKNAASAIFPIGDPVEATGPLKTALEIEFNWNSFTERDIVPVWERDLKLSLREGQKYSSGAGQSLAKVLRSSGIEADARQVDHLLNSYGGLGQMVTGFTKPGGDTKATAIKSTGYVVEPPSVAARDVQWVSTWAKENGKTMTSAMKPFRELRKEVLAQKTAEARDEKAKELRKMATKMRAQIERDGKIQ